MLVGQRFEVLVVPKTHPELGHSGGTTRIYDQRIYISDNLGPDQYRDTLLHEVMHALVGLVNPQADKEESFVETVTPLLLDAMRRNPPLVTVLMEGAW